MAGSTRLRGRLFLMTRTSANLLVSVTIKTNSINTDNTSRDNDLRSAGYFDVEKFPEITFQANR